MSVLALEDHLHWCFELPANVLCEVADDTVALSLTSDCSDLAVTALGEGTNT